MAEYIERGKAINEFAIHSPFYDAERGNKRFTLDDVEEILQSIPAANVRPAQRGKWIYDHWCEFKCSNCGAWSKSEPYRGRENFCPNCGAKMCLE